MRVHNAFVLYLLSVTALQKDEGYFPSAAVLEPKYSSKIFKWQVSQRGADVSYILIQLLLIVSQKLAELYSLT